MALNTQQIIHIIEAALFTAGEPLSLERLQGLFEESAPPERQQLRQYLQQISEFYQDRGIELIEVASGYRFQARQNYSAWLQRLFEKRPQRYSRALLETLALIVYRQPITRGEIEDIRGVAVSTQIMKTLTEREWIRVIGQRDIPGKPNLYGTTKQFLDDFNLKNLMELPPLAELKDLDAVAQQLELNLGEPDSQPQEICEDDGET